MNRIKPLWTPLHARLQATLKEKKLLPEGTPILIALSGGQDSLCLTRLLIDLRDKWGWTLGIAHCDHGWSIDTGLAARVGDIVNGLGLPFYLETAPPMAETENSAREWRYDSLLRIARGNGFTRVVTGHTLSDRAETFLYNLIRGSGGRGLSSLNWQRALDTDVLLIRPLLNFARSETGEFCRQFNLPVQDDRANEDTKYTRVRLRRELIPWLEKHVNRGVEVHLNRTAEILAGENEFLESIARELFSRIRDDQDRSIDRLCLRDSHLCIQRRVIIDFFREYAGYSPNFEEIEAVISLIGAPERSFSPSFRGGIRVGTREGRLVFLNREPPG